jgi:hypothetical protein
MIIGNDWREDTLFYKFKKFTDLIHTVSNEYPRENKA